jgi:secondary thiamine-phosphate synthase enzyme
MQEFTIQTARQTAFVDVTGQVETALTHLDLEDGAALVFVPHTTAAVTINEGADPAVVRDIDVSLVGLVPQEGDYRHAEGNSAAHIKATLVGNSELVIVAGGRLELGTWQKIWFCEFDGPRRRRVWVQPLAVAVSE